MQKNHKIIGVSLIYLILFGQLNYVKAQNYQTIEDVNDACAQLGFSSDEEAEIAVDKILDAVGLFRNFVIQECPDINNAVAKVIEISVGYKERFILYDNHFFDNMDSNAGTDWASMSILAHEIGHHLNGHSINNEGSNHKFELEADYFSGSALAKLGATLEESQSAILTLKYEKATYTHPAKADRLAAIEEGWSKFSPGKNVSPTKKVEVVNNEDANIEIFDYDKNLVDSYIIKLSSYYEDKNYISAAKASLKAFQYSNGKEFIYLYYTASCYISAMDYDNGLKYYLALIRNGIDQLDQEKQHEIYKNIGLIYQHQNRKEEALQFFDFALRKNPNDVSILLTRANLYFQSGDIETFEAEVKKVIRLDPNNPELYFNLGVLAVERGANKEAKQYYNKVLSLDPNYKNALLNLSALILSEEISIIEAMNNLGSSKADDLKYNELKKDRLTLYREALVYLEQYIDIDARNMDVLNTTENVYTALGDQDNVSRIKRLKNKI